MESTCESTGMPFDRIALVVCKVLKYKSCMFTIQNTIENMSWQQVLSNLLTVVYYPAYYMPIHLLICGHEIFEFKLFYNHMCILSQFPTNTLWWKS